MHALGAPPAFVLSQDQTLHRKFDLPNFHLVLDYLSRPKPVQMRSLVESNIKGCHAEDGGPHGGMTLLFASLALLPSPKRLKQAKRMLAFDTLFSCQGARIPARTCTWGASYHSLTRAARQNRSPSRHGSATCAGGIQSQLPDECKSRPGASPPLLWSTISQTTPGNLYTELARAIGQRNLRYAKQSFHHFEWGG